MEDVAYGSLISPIARHRWRKWRSDMIKLERREKSEEGEKFGTSHQTTRRELYQTLMNHDHDELKRKAHEDCMYEEALAYYLQTESPPPRSRDTNSLATPARSGSEHSQHSHNPVDDTGNTTPDRHPDEASDPDPLRRSSFAGSLGGIVNHPFANSTQKFSPISSHTSSPKRARLVRPDRDQHQDQPDPNMEDACDAHYVQSPPPRKFDWAFTGQKPREAFMVGGNDGYSNQYTPEPSVRFDSSTGTYYVVPQPPVSPTPQAGPSSSTPNTADLSRAPMHLDGKDDVITDTVGAIAIDMFGNIACAASSGGIGMKHRGRVGPAALVNVGAAVIPTDDDDPEGRTVATVTSGTGEHMTSTMAARLCSERVYQSQRKVRGLHEDCMEEEAVHGFIKTDFMGHPSVGKSQSTGAVGTLSVKKTVDGVYFLFGHNTDSFALASMHSDEDRPVLTMSRSNGGGSVAQGGRYVKYRKGSTP